MPVRTIPASSVSYALITFGSDGLERGDDRDGLMSARVLEAARDGGITNIFVFSHGWMGDVPAAIEQYDRWVRAFHDSSTDRERAAKLFPGFRPLYVGLHWPSLPWGDEEIAEGSFDAAAPAPDELRRLFLSRLGDSPAIHAALDTILEEARNAQADRLSSKARDAFLKLNDALGLEADGVAGAPGADREPFDPDTTFQPDGVSFGASGVFDGVLGLLRHCSYWAMKKRARDIGEGGMHHFIVALQRVTRARIHLMGHSFGCVLTSAILKGSGTAAQLERPIDSVMLAQGALSLWSYASAIPFDGLGAGYFHGTIAQNKVAGPLVTTQSRFDTAVGRLYPLASQVSREVAFEPGELPKFGAVGTFGLQGLAESIKHDQPMLAAGVEYEFLPGHVYNLDGSQFISHGSGSSGAHNDIDGPEVAHAIWHATFASAGE